MKHINTNFERLRSLPTTRCATRGSRRSYTNPMAKRFFCEKKFCFDHIWAGNVLAGLKGK